MKNLLITYLNLLLPKFNFVIIRGFPNIEPSAVILANYINNNYKYKVYFIIDSNLPDNPQKVLNPNIIIKKSK